MRGRTPLASRPALRRCVAVIAGAMLLAGACSSDDEADTRAGGEASGATTAPSTAPEGTTSPGDDAGAPAADDDRWSPSEVYAQPENWICSPLADDDPCDRDLTTTVVQADGSTEVVAAEPDPDAPVDCFYVYPTVNGGAGTPADEAMADDIVAETGVATAQLARFGTACRIWAPLYRQLTFDGFGAENGEELRARAYQDVRDAFSHYMSEANDGRPFVLYGHSQGSGMLQQLLAEEFDGDEALTDQLLSAMLIGGRPTVAEGADVGGSFESLPVCRAPDQTGCIIGYNSMAPGADETLLAQWGSADPGEQKVCTNPAALAGGPAPLRSIVEPDEGATGALAVDTPYVQLDGALIGECVQRGDATVLEVTVAEGWPAADLERLSTNVSFWGLHIVDVNLAEADLIDLVVSQTEAHGG